MHYFLADREAAQRDEGARALLLDVDGFVTEASTANVLLYSRRLGLVSPPKDKIIPGISLATVQDLAAELNIPFCFRDLRPSELLEADEVMLCSTSPCLLPVSTLDGNLINGGAPGPVFQRLISAWGKQVGVDIVQQARDAANAIT